MTRGMPCCIVEASHTARDIMRPERDGPMAAKKRKQQRPQRVPTKTPHVPTAPVELHPVVLSEYDITDEPLENRHIKRLPAQAQASIDYLYELAQTDRTQEISDLEHLV